MCRSLPGTRKPNDGAEVAIKVMKADDEEELRARRYEFDILCGSLACNGQCKAMVTSSMVFLLKFGVVIQLLRKAYSRCL